MIDEREASDTELQIEILKEPEIVQEHFRRIQATYRSQAIHTPEEWPMDKPEGRKAYYKSVKRDALLRSP